MPPPPVPPPPIWDKAGFDVSAETEAVISDIM
jgi:hypothetical protein